MRSNSFNTKKTPMRAQAALDFIMSYGVGILIITLALYIVFELGIFNPNLQISQCTPNVGFGCESYAVFSNGTLYTILSQDTSTTLNITAAACSTNINTTTNAPQYGNIHILSDKVAPVYYPDSSMLNGITAYSGNIFTLRLNCYNSQGIASSQLGGPFVGYVWLNYTSSGLPSTEHQVTRVIEFTTKYT